MQIFLSDPVELRTRTCGSLSLGYSRRGHAWAFERLDAEHLYESVVRAFAYFGGVTAELLVDNPKALVLQHHQGEGAVFNERFLDLWRTKGKDERLVHYLKHHFFVRYRAFESWAHLNQLLETWLREEADQRVHGTVREVVADCGSPAAVARRPRGAQAASGCNSDAVTVSEGRTCRSEYTSLARACLPAAQAGGRDAGTVLAITSDARLSHPRLANAASLPASFQVSA